MGGSALILYVAAGAVLSWLFLVMAFFWTHVSEQSVAEVIRDVDAAP